jgi:hypothetical protein
MSDTMTLEFVAAQMSRFAAELPRLQLLPSGMVDLQLLKAGGAA